ncbi:transcriptional regulator [Aquincola tertiaricarbonis]|uniref:transcriptional regulator n=1 Tax=Aquincola tertiaricarbonis TaxID=391953 RepID=UPI0009F8B16F|nr:transcriptional regulator [Aquincola tertiaricarbonis]
MDITPPTPDQIREVVTSAGVTRSEAAALVHVQMNAWHNWCAPAASVKHRQMPLAAWELLLLKLDLHPTKKMVDR